MWRVFVGVFVVFVLVESGCDRLVWVVVGGVGWTRLCKEGLREEEEKERGQRAREREERADLI